jgi:hypothetical protein
MSCFWNKDGKCRHPGQGVAGRNVNYCATCPRRISEDLPGPNILKKAASYVVAETSRMFQGPVSETVYKRRLEICNACDRLHRTDQPGKLGWCGACGCGHNARAELTVKGQMPKATCPKGLWDKEDAERAPLPDTLGR